VAIIALQSWVSRRRWLGAAVLAALLAGCAPMPGAMPSGDPLPSWSEAANKQRIVDFVKAVTSEGGKDYVVPGERIAVFDNDGTLWAEQQMYFQLFFALDRVKALAPQHPEWKDTEPFASLLKGDVKAALAGGEHAIVEIIMATHAGMTSDEFAKIVGDWAATARHPTTNRRFTEMVYQPMLEVLAYLRANGFKTFIVSGGGIEFMRPWTEKVYGIPPEQVIGSSIKTQFEVRGGKPVLMRLAQLDFIDDKEGKPVGINLHIGRRPIAAFGNSDGDFQMLQWATAGSSRRLGMLVHHDDAAREYAYDRNSSIGRLVRGLDEYRAMGWGLISMKNDWKIIFPPLQ
jgi:phosphoglycolate phosphatase-like HAD superfamily hydrolase